MWAPLPLWREDNQEQFVIGSLTYWTAGPMLVRVGHESGGFADYPGTLLDDSLVMATRYGEYDVQPCGYEPSFLLARFESGGQLWRAYRFSVLAFLASTRCLVPYGREGEHIDWDGGLARMVDNGSDRHEE